MDNENGTKLQVAENEKKKIKRKNKRQKRGMAGKKISEGVEGEKSVWRAMKN